MKKFTGATFNIGLVPYGHETTYNLEFGRKETSGLEARDYASNGTGALVAALLMQLSLKEWEGAIKTLKRIKKEEMA